MPLPAAEEGDGTRQPNTLELEPTHDSVVTSVASSVSFAAGRLHPAGISLARREAAFAS
jgi:hypothetical protein